MGSTGNERQRRQRTGNTNTRYSLACMLSSPTFSVSVTSPDQTFVTQCLVCGLRLRERRAAVDRVYPGPLYSFIATYLIVIITRWLFARWDIGTLYRTIFWKRVWSFELRRHVPEASGYYLWKDYDVRNLRTHLRPSQRLRNTGSCKTSSCRATTTIISNFN